MSEVFYPMVYNSADVLNGVPVPSLPIGGIELEPSEAYVRVSDSTMTFVPSSVAFLGLNAGDPVWTLPQSNTPGVPFLGLAAEELNPLQFNSAGFRLTGFRGPLGGQFALFQLPAFSAPVVFMRTNDGVSPTSDFYSVPIEGHDHANFGFTKAGLYELDIQGYASGPAGSFTDSGTFLFAVGNLTTVPEPTSFALILAPALGLVISRRRRCMS